MSDTLACVSVRQPWADLLAAGIKPFENRGWYCNHRGSLVIHAGKTWKDDEEDAYIELMYKALKIKDRWRQGILARSRSRLGGFVGICNMRMCISAKDWFSTGGLEYDGEHQWFTGPYGWVITGSQMFSHVIPYRGQQGLFRVPRHVVPWPAGWKSPGKYWVNFFVGGFCYRRTMTGMSARHIAAEIREQYPSAKITAIRELKRARTA